MGAGAFIPSTLHRFSLSTLPTSQGHGRVAPVSHRQKVGLREQKASLDSGAGAGGRTGAQTQVSPILASQRLHAEPHQPGPVFPHAHKLGVVGNPSESPRGLFLNTMETSFSSIILDGDEQGQVTQVFGSLARRMEFPETLQ